MSLVEWFWGTQAIMRAREAQACWSPIRVESLRRAALAAEAGDAIFEPRDPLRGDGAQLALTLYQQAVYWALCAAADVGAGVPLDQLFDRCKDLLVKCAGSIEQVSSQQLLLVDANVLGNPQISAAGLRLEVARVRDLVHALLRSISGPVNEVERLTYRRARRVGALLLLCVVIPLGGLWHSYKPDLAVGKSWVSSSAFSGFASSGTITANPSLFFHTLEEDDPWLEIDLGDTTEISAVEVRNRSDCCAERATPLRIEVSTDRSSWTTVAERTGEFERWSPSFAAQAGRYVRVHAPRKTFLHLDKVAVYP